MLFIQACDHYRIPEICVVWGKRQFPYISMLSHSFGASSIPTILLCHSVRDLSGNNLPCSFKVLLITIRFESLSIEHKELLKFTIFFFLKQMFSTACICMPLHTVNFHITFGFLTKWSVLWIPFFPSIFIPGRVHDAICCDMAVLCPCVCYVLTYLELQLFTFSFPIVLCLMKYVFFIFLEHFRDFGKLMVLIVN